MGSYEPMSLQWQTVREQLDFADSQQCTFYECTKNHVAVGKRRTGIGIQKTVVNCTPEAQSPRDWIKLVKVRPEQILLISPESADRYGGCLLQRGRMHSHGVVLLCLR